MNKVVDEYGDISFSLQPHGLRSRLRYCKKVVLTAIAMFIIVFGGALLAATPAQADPGDVSCFVEVTPDPTASPAPTAPVVEPTSCPTPAPAPTVTVTITETATSTVTATVTVIKTVFVTKTQIQTQDVTVPVTVAPTKTQDPTSPPATPEPSETPPAGTQPGPSDGTSPLVPIALTVAGVTGVAIAGAVFASVVKRRKLYRGAHVAGTNYGPEEDYDVDEQHIVVADDTDTEQLPPVSS